MHFHLPKPLHGWREFAGEVGIIVVGVLIALGAEQVVEGMRWKERAHQAREALGAEFVGHYDQAVEWRTVEPCVAAQLDRLEQRLLSSGDRIDPAPMFRETDRTFVLRAPSRPYPASVWQGVLAEGVSSHLTETERLDLGIYYQQVHDLDALNKELIATETKLNSLARPIALDPSSRLSLLQSIDDIRDTNRWMGVIAGQLVTVLIDVDMLPPEREARAYLTKSGTVAFCRAHGLPLRPFAEALKPLS